MEFKTIPRDDLVSVLELMREYVDEKISIEELEMLYSKFPVLFIGCYCNNELVGACIPGVLEGEIFIKGIAVKHELWRKGIGTSLLKHFEENLKKIGINKVSVPSAPIDWVERFYIKNGFKPARFMVKVSKDALKNREYVNRYEVVGERKEGEFKIIYIKASGYDPKSRARIKKEFNAEEVLYIMEKNL